MPVSLHVCVCVGICDSYWHTSHVYTQHMHIYKTVSFFPFFPLFLHKRSIVYYCGENFFFSVFFCIHITSFIIINIITFVDVFCYCYCYYDYLDLFSFRCCCCCYFFSLKYLSFYYVNMTFSFRCLSSYFFGKHNYSGWYFSFEMLFPSQNRDYNDETIAETTIATTTTTKKIYKIHLENIIELLSQLIFAHWLAYLYTDIGKEIYAKRVSWIVDGIMVLALF